MEQTLSWEQEACHPVAGDEIWREAWEREFLRHVSRGEVSEGHCAFSIKLRFNFGKWWMLRLSFVIACSQSTLSAIFWLQKTKSHHLG